MADIFDLFRKISGGSSPSSAPVSYLIVGLGNPGDEYATTRHNMGFIAIDTLAHHWGVQIDRMKFHALTAEYQLNGQKVLLMKPMTFMNLSGTAVSEAASFYKLAPDHILVISDDVNLPLGKIRIRKGGSAGGQNGLKNIIERIGSQDFPRLRIGVGSKPHPDYDLAAWVLSNFTKSDLEVLKESVHCAEDGIKLLLDGKFDEAVQLCNSHRPVPKNQEDHS